MRKGYMAEYKTKKELIERYGKQNVLKVAIGGAVDFLVLKPGKNKIEKIVEVKECHKKKYYPYFVSFDFCIINNRGLFRKYQNLNPTRRGMVHNFI